MYIYYLIEKTIILTNWYELLQVQGMLEFSMYPYSLISFNYLFLLSICKAFALKMTIIYTYKRSWNCGFWRL